MRRCWNKQFMSVDTKHDLAGFIKHLSICSAKSEVRRYEVFLCSVFRISYFRTEVRNRCSEIPSLTLFIYSAIEKRDVAGYGITSLVSRTLVGCATNEVRMDKSQCDTKSKVIGQLTGITGID